MWHLCAAKHVSSKDLRSYELYEKERNIKDIANGPFWTPFETIRKSSFYITAKPKTTNPLLSPVSPVSTVSTVSPVSHVSFVSPASPVSPVFLAYCCTIFL